MTGEMNVVATPAAVGEGTSTRLARACMCSEVVSGPNVVCRVLPPARAQTDMRVLLAAEIRPEKHSPAAAVAQMKAGVPGRMQMRMRLRVLGLELGRGREWMHDATCINVIT